MSLLKKTQKNKQKYILYIYFYIIHFLIIYFVVVFLCVFFNSDKY